MSYGFHYFKGDNLDRITRLKNKICELVDNISWPDTEMDVSQSWLKIHFFTTAQLAQLLALRRGKDRELAEAVGLLHDIGLLVNSGMEKQHAVNGYDRAKEILTEVGGFSAEEIELIANAAARHSEKDKVGNWLEELIKDVDVLDCALHGSDFSAFEHHFKRVKNLEKELGIKLA